MNLEVHNSFITLELILQILQGILKIKLKFQKYVYILESVTKYICHYNFTIYN